MKNSTRKAGQGLLALACLLAVAGCQPSGSSPDNKAEASNTNSSSVVNTVANTASNVVDATSNAVSSVGAAARSVVSSSTNVDNSGINARDRNGATLTPGDQGNSPNDVALTQQIRKALVMGTNDFSVVAQNVKIITTDGKVTLRGPVNTESEKNGIVAMANVIAGPQNVVDQIEVKPSQ